MTMVTLACVGLLDNPPRANCEAGRLTPTKGEISPVRWAARRVLT